MTKDEFQKLWDQQAAFWIDGNLPLADYIWAGFERHLNHAPEAKPSIPLKALRLQLLSMGTDHVVAGSPGPLFNAGWSKACEVWSKRLLGLLDVSEPQRGKE